MEGVELLTGVSMNSGAMSALDGGIGGGHGVDEVGCVMCEEIDLQVKQGNEAGVVCVIQHRGRERHLQEKEEVKGIRGMSL
jgi:hypothetical protein